MCHPGSSLLVSGKNSDNLCACLFYNHFALRGTKIYIYVDSLEVYALVSESTVDVLPFPISIDRYSAVVGGSQTFDPETFDLDYNYHVSVLKSPLPFKAGIDISGNLDNFDYKVSKAKLKKTDFDEQRKIYDDYCQSIKESEQTLINQIDQRREVMRAKRREQREAEEKREERAEL